ncbi:MAG TPA: hypothetical protein VNI57_11370, partial [Candidatus Saccharimonadales bacterium]|nr:hypothetical protein [Candidatus Saccharimonadales bacterium]
AETLSSGTGSIAAARAAAFRGLGPGPWTCRNREGLEVTVTLETAAAGGVVAVLAGEVGFLYHGRLRREIFERRAGSGPAPTTAPGKSNRA